MSGRHQPSPSPVTSRSAFELCWTHSSLWEQTLGLTPSPDAIPLSPCPQRWELMWHILVSSQGPMMWLS